MNFLNRICLLSFLWLAFFQTNAQESLPALRWYKNITVTREAASVKTLLEENSDKLLAAREIQDDSATLFLALEKGLIHLLYKYDYDSAMTNFLEAFETAERTTNTPGIVFSYVCMAKVFNGVGNPARSSEFLNNAYQQAATLGDKEVQVLVLQELGDVKVVLDDLGGAEENYTEALKLAELLRNDTATAEVYSSLGKLAGLNENYTGALNFLKKALSIRRSLGDKVSEGILLNEIGAIYFLQNNVDRAYANFKAALEVCNAANYSEGVAAAYNNIGEWYYKQNNSAQALPNFELALTAGRASRSDNLVLKSYEYLSLLYKEAGNFKSALEYKELQLALQELITKERDAREVMESQRLAELEKADAKVEKLEIVRKERERELAEQKRMQKFLYAIIGLIGLVVLLVLYMYLSKRRSNKELQAINAKVEAQNSELQSLNATKDKFFSIIGHDLKGPLNSLTSFSNLLINYFDTLSKEEIQTLAKDLDKSIKNLFTLLNNLLEWARSQTGNIDFTPEEFNMSQVLQQNKELLEAQASAKKITILQEQELPLMVRAHSQSITTVVRNLISNAIKFTPQGGIIKVSAEKKEKEVIVSIADTGVGMSKTVMDKLFRLDAKHSTIGTANEKGTGLGLILCKDFVEKCGGRLWVESEEGKGSVFYFSIPGT